MTGAIRTVLSAGPLLAPMFALADEHGKDVLEAGLGLLLEGRELNPKEMARAITVMAMLAKKRVSR